MPDKKDFRPLSGFVTWCDSTPKVADSPTATFKGTPLKSLIAVLIKADERPVADPDGYTFSNLYEEWLNITPDYECEASDNDGKFKSKDKGISITSGTYWIGIKEHLCFGFLYLKKTTSAGEKWVRQVDLEQARFVWQLRWKNNKWQILNDLGENAEDKWVDLKTSPSSEEFTFHCMKVMPYEKIPDRNTEIGEYPEPPEPPYGLYPAEGNALRVEVEQPESRRPPFFIYIPKTNELGGTGNTDLSLIKNTILRPNFTLSEFTYPIKGNLKCRYVPVMKYSLLEKLQVLRDLKGGVSIKRGFIPPKDSLAKAPIRDDKKYGDIAGLNTTGWLDRHAYGDAVDIEGKETDVKLAETTGFDVVRSERHGGKRMIHLDDRGYKLFSIIFEAYPNRGVTWNQFEEIEIDSVKDVLGEPYWHGGNWRYGLLQYVPQEFGGAGNSIPDETEVNIWNTYYYNQYAFPLMNPTNDQKTWAKIIRKRGCGPTSQRMQLEHFNRHPTQGDRAVPFSFGEICTREFILNDHLEHVEAHYPALFPLDGGRGASIAELLTWANKLGKINDTAFEMRWAYTRSFFGSDGDTAKQKHIEPELMICSGGTVDSIGKKKADYMRDHFEAQILNPIEFIREYIKNGPIQVLVMHNLKDATTPFRKERYSKAKASNEDSASSHYILVTGYAKITTDEDGDRTSKEYVIVCDSDPFVGKYLLHKADSFLKAWTHRYAEWWLGALLSFSNSVYLRPYKPELAGSQELFLLSNTVGTASAASRDEIQAVQERLEELGFQVGPDGPNGVFTSRYDNLEEENGVAISYSTEAAIMRFQFTALEMDPPSGVFDPGDSTHLALLAFDAIRWINVSSDRVKFNNNNLKNRFHPRLARLLEDLGDWAEGESIDLNVKSGSEGYPGDGRHTTRRYKNHYRGLAVTLEPSGKVNEFTNKMKYLKKRYLDIQFKKKSGNTYVIWIS
ncbi:MAG: peptidoglycan-binding protein [Candidatus Hodarchaeota archaeon]